MLTIGIEIPNITTQISAFAPVLSITIPANTPPIEK